MQKFFAGGLAGIFSLNYSCTLNIGMLSGTKHLYFALENQFLRAKNWGHRLTVVFSFRE
jgi:hypothetical protein